MVGSTRKTHEMLTSCGKPSRAAQWLSGVLVFTSWPTGFSDAVQMESFMTPLLEVRKVRKASWKSNAHHLLPKCLCLKLPKSLTFAQRSMPVVEFSWSAHTSITIKYRAIWASLAFAGVILCSGHRWRLAWKGSPSMKSCGTTCWRSLAIFIAIGSFQSFYFARDLKGKK